LLKTEQDRSWPQLTLETDGAVIVRVNTAEDEDLPAGEPMMVRVYIPGGTIDVVEIVSVDVAPVDEGATLVGENVKAPHGLDP
jgi:hypothetical protein